MKAQAAIAAAAVFGSFLAVYAMIITSVGVLLSSIA